MAISPEPPQRAAPTGVFMSGAVPNGRPLVFGIEKGLSCEVGDVSFPATSRPFLFDVTQPFRFTRARNSRHPARPYIDRLMSLSRFT